MLKSRLAPLAYAGLLLSLVAAPAFAQTATPAAPATPTAAAVGTDVSQQQQIEGGLQSGALTTKEAAKLENGEKRIDNVEAKDMKTGGTLTPAEQTQINTMQNNEQTRINKLSTNATTGNPNSVSSQRMQGDVQRNVTQEQRIQNGVNNGTLTNKQAGRLEKGQARTARKEAAAGANGHISAAGQARIQKSEDRQSGHVYRAKHNVVPAPTTVAPAVAPVVAPAAAPVAPAAPATPAAQ